MSTKIPSHIRLKEALQRAGLKQIELANITGISKSTLSQYFSGDYEPKQKNLHKLASALNVDEAWLMGFDVPVSFCDIIPKDEISIKYKLNREEMAEYKKIMDMNMLMFNDKDLSKKDKIILEKTLKDIFIKSLLRKRKKEKE